jgi:hypothetical protein
MTMAELSAKQTILESGGYVYNFDRRSYINRGAKKVFSVEFIEDHSADELEQRILEPSDARKWRFYFNSEPSESVRRQLEIALG